MFWFIDFVLDILFDVFTGDPPRIPQPSRRGNRLRGPPQPPDSCPGRASRPLLRVDSGIPLKQIYMI